jgi:fructose-1,6-bisphosphatase I
LPVVNTKSMIITLQQHVLRQQTHFPGADGTFSWLLSGITLATKMVSARIRRGGLLDTFGAAGEINVQGEAQQKLDVYANQVLLHCLGLRENVALLVSEENEEPIELERAAGTGKYLVVFDPLDGSSNIDVNVNVGTIFSIFRRSDEYEHVLQPGLKQIAAGYVVYGPSTILVYTTGDGVYCFTLDPAIGAYVLTQENIKMPEQGVYYSVNEANSEAFPAPYSQFLQRLRGGINGRRYAGRYIGSLVADFHRTLLKGGIFMYPPTASYPGGKLRLLYEANPLAFIAEQAGGMAVDGAKRILEIQPAGIHQRTAFVCGSKVEVEELLRLSKCGLG